MRSFAFCSLSACLTSCLLLFYGAILFATPTCSVLTWDPHNHQYCLLARPARPTNEPYWSNWHVAELRRCWGEYVDKSDGWSNRTCGGKTWYSDSLEWEEPSHCHNACKPCINAALDSGADAAVCYREAGVRGATACQMGYSPRDPWQLVTGDSFQLCDANGFPERCWLRTAHSAQSNLAAPDDNSWHNDTWRVKHEFVDIQQPLDEWRESRQRVPIEGDDWCQHGGCMNDAGGKDAWAYFEEAKTRTWPHWGVEGVPDNRPRTAFKPPKAIDLLSPPFYSNKTGWTGGEPWPGQNQSEASWVNTRTGEKKKDKGQKL